MLGNGNILIYDNGNTRKRTRVVEVDPRTRKIVWSYEPGFHAPAKGSAEGLPNGNVFLIEPARARAIEGTREGELVWEYFVPAGSVKRRNLYRMARIDPGLVAEQLQSESSAE